MSRLRPATLVLAGIAAVSTLAAVGAQARTFVGVGIGLGFPPPVAYPPPYYYPPPPPVVYGPPVNAPAPSYEPSAESGAGSYSTATCREYDTTIVVGGQPQPSHGTACLQPDGTWRIMN